MAEKTKIWYLENFNLFKGLSKAEMMELGERSVMKTASKNQFIYFPDEPSSTVFLLKEGKVKLGSYSDDGKEIIKAILQGGEIFGELGLAGEETRSDFALALDDDVTICAVGQNVLEDMMKKNPNLGLKITKIIGFRFRKLERRLESLVFKDARTRVVEFLKDQGIEQGEKVGDETLIRNFLTHQDIANLTATSRQTVTTVLNELREKDLIYFDRKRILIRDLATLS
ncbi:Crp/Fnr family transcriptional regulator [bacterium AH-315-C07]|nr:Crp/Fnr family transcriptional regulator [bacterium AH-315-C07]